MSSEKIFYDLFEHYPVLCEARDDILNAYAILCDCYDSLGKVLVCGNGGSAADSDHIVGELMKGFMSKRPLQEDDAELFAEEGKAGFALKLQGALPAISLNAHAALISAFANDVDPDYVFAQQVWGYSKNSPDALIALSTSGNSQNVVNACIAAEVVGIDSIGITGANESKMSDICTVCIKLPATETYKVQELTLPVYHALCAALEANYFD